MLAAALPPAGVSLTPQLIAGALLLASALASLIPGQDARHSWLGRLTALAALAACAIGAVAAGHTLVTGATADLHATWSVPGGSFALHVDALAALFLLPVFVLGGLGIVYGREYWRLPDGRQPRIAWAWYYVFLWAMALVVLASNAVLFLFAWEAMSVAAFFLVAHDDEEPEVRHAAWMFLIAAHIGTAFLLVMFAVLGRGVETLDFADLNGAAHGGVAAGAVTLLALAGFGTKAGLVPGHVWLPAAHPAAPSHVSAVLSGAMLKTGIYGVLRVYALLPQTPAWAGWLLIGAGMASGILGILFALGQSDLKRLLADSSIENLGLITMAVGVGIAGREEGLDTVAALGFSAALLHVLNHALFKGLLFLAAGAVVHATGTRNMRELGGLLRAMPWTGSLFLLGSAAIIALPPFNGFVSEFLLFLAAFKGLGASEPGVVAAMAAVIAGLGVIGGLAAMAYLKAALVFLGQPRSARVEHAQDPGRGMRAAMLVLAAGCLAIGIAPFAAVSFVHRAAAVAGGLDAAAVDREVAASGILTRVALVTGVAMTVTILAWLIRAGLLARRPVGRSAVWSTAYLAPSPRQQYSGASLAQPLLGLYWRILRPVRTGGPPVGYFPVQAAFAIDTPGLFRERLFLPAFRGVERVALKLRWLQHGRVQLYLLNIAVTLVVLLIWKLGIGL